MVNVDHAQAVMIAMTLKTKQLNLHFSDLEEKMRDYATAHYVPIIQDEGLALLETVIRLAHPKMILEIGTAIGYSAIRMHQVCGSKVYTIERDEVMFYEALKNIKEAGYEYDIKVILQDALEAFPLVEQLQFDLIFIDAAKAQYTKFFDIYTPLLKPNGIVICDNLTFHGLTENVEEYENQSRSVKGLIRKLNDFKRTLLANEEYISTILPLGDGMAIAVKK